ncbi:hypothetical protein GGS21DRAFT_519806 [Xylaria nigripes]|nr:hypothetical protein GGS21DRAFT_519806 [Xylaria nigripes]
MTSLLRCLWHVGYRASLLVLHCLLFILKYFQTMIAFLYPGRLPMNENRLGEYEESRKHSAVEKDAYRDYVQFLDLWNKPDKSNLIFVSLALQIHSREGNGITGIGLCTWPPSSSSSRMSGRFWSITDAAHTGEMRNRSSAYKKAVLISKSDIKVALDDAFEPLVANYQSIVLVGNHIRSQLEVLNRFWKPPRSLIILDSYLIRQHHFESRTSASPEGATAAISQDPWDPDLSHIQGDDAQYPLHLLQALGVLADESL